MNPRVPVLSRSTAADEGHPTLLRSPKEESFDMLRIFYSDSGRNKKSGWLTHTRRMRKGFKKLSSGGCSRVLHSAQELYGGKRQGQGENSEKIPPYRVPSPRGGGLGRGATVSQIQGIVQMSFIGANAPPPIPLPRGGGRK